MPALDFSHSGRPLFTHLLRTGRTLVGRSDRCDVALPSDQLSRTHCVVEHRADGWWLVDRSRHGTKVNGKPIAQRHALSQGDEIQVGPYRATFSLTASGAEETTQFSATIAAPPVDELVEVVDDAVTTSRAELRFLAGTRQGENFLLRQALTRLGGPGADLVLDASLPADAVTLRVVRGRVLVEPGATPSWLAGARVRQLTPAYLGESLRVGEHVALIAERTEAEAAGHRSCFGEMVGESEAAQRLFGILARVAPHDSPVLLCGESGTGKELAARGLHQASPRHEGPFVALNCAAITDALFESELFGHERGSFTGATARQDGAFQRADGGTLFLDEVGELTAEGQAKLLRALESGEVRRVGGARPEHPDVRIVAATNRDLPRMVREGSFREDLYFRLSVLAVRLPPLRERRGDIPVLCNTLMARLHHGDPLPPATIAALQSYDWPGNIRELRNVLTRAYVLAGPKIHPGDLVFNPWSFEEAPPSSSSSEPPLQTERRAIAEALARHGGNRSKTAQALNMARSSLLYKMRKHGLT